MYITKKLEFISHYQITINVQWAGLSLKSDLFRDNLWMERKVRKSIYRVVIGSMCLEELDGRAVSALGVRSRKLSTGRNGQSEDR
jgi:hypothetical protein